MTTINQLLKTKGRHFFSIGPNETIDAAIAVMANHDVGSVLVMNGFDLVGVVTERHVARDILLKGRTSPQTLVREIMETDVMVAEPDDTVDICLKIMTEHRVRHLPVMEARRVVGIVSIGDLVKSTIDDQRFMIDQLEGYIHGECLLH